LQAGLRIESATERAGCFTLLGSRTIGSPYCATRVRTATLQRVAIRRYPDPGTLHAVKECLVGVLAMDSLALLNQSTAAGFKLLKNMSAPVIHFETLV
jgi:hypothetical protein